MIILPAIDIQNRQCVRLVKGDFGTAHTVADDPLETAAAFRRAGAEWIHMVDLDGARTGNRVNADIFFAVAAQSGLKVELGGGIRDMETLEDYLSGGISRCILGSRRPQKSGFWSVKRFRFTGIASPSESMRWADGWLLRAGWRSHRSPTWNSPPDGRHRRSNPHLYRYLQGRNPVRAEPGTAGRARRGGLLQRHRLWRYPGTPGYRTAAGPSPVRRDLRQILVQRDAGPRRRHRGGRHIRRTGSGLSVFSKKRRWFRLSCRRRRPARC